MLSDATSAPRATRDVSADAADDFEWVNAWAAATSPQVSKPVVRESVPQGTALVQELAHIPAKPQRAAEVAPVELISLEQSEELVATPAAAEPAAAPVQLVATEPVDAAPTMPAEAVATSVEAPHPEDEVEAVAAPLDPAALGDASGLASVAPLESDVAAAAGTLAEEVNAPTTTAPELVELIDEHPAPADERASAPISFLDFAWRAKRWRNLFGMARTRLSEPNEELDPLEALPRSSDPIAADVDEADAPALLELAPAIAPNQLELDIAEIELQRDALLAEWEHERRTAAMKAVPAAPAARSRTTDYVPILLGCVLGFTLLVVFGAAASFVSLR
jgi:hypothetical protein